MTAYSPAMLALQDMLKAQLELTREFLQNQDRLYREYTTDIQANYRYTTLEDTKQVNKWENSLDATIILYIDLQESLL